MEKLKTAIQLDKERYAAAERRFLQETDRERQIAIRLQKDIDQGRMELYRLQEQRRDEELTHQGLIGDLKHQMGVLEGRLQTITTEREQLAKDLHATQSANSQLTSRLIQLESEIQKREQSSTARGRSDSRLKGAPTAKRVKPGNSKSK